MTRKRFDEDFKKQLVKIYNQGNHSYRSLSEEYGVSAPYYYNMGHKIQ